MDEKISDGAGAVKVFIRDRPLRKERGETNIWELSDTSLDLCDTDQKDAHFEFDKVFSQANNKVVYDHAVRNPVKGCLDGFNVSLFCYGQTGSGKTHTMLGTEEDPGVLLRAAEDLISSCSKARHERYLIRVSYFEIYNEEIRDLLSDEGTSLKIVEHRIKGPTCVGATERFVTSRVEISNVILEGQNSRHVAATKMNEHSSRSHTIFRISVESRGCQEGQGGLTPLDEIFDEVQSRKSHNLKMSMFNLIDLAGSERASKTGATGNTLKEGSMINKSLTSLGIVINELSKAKDDATKRKHIPYRDSKLTRLLQTALGGNSFTVSICNISTAQLHVNETKSTLRFASGCKLVENKVKQNTVKATNELLANYKQEIETLKRQLSETDNSQMEKMRAKIEKEKLEMQETLKQQQMEIAVAKAAMEHDRMYEVSKEQVLGKSSGKLRMSIGGIPISAQASNEAGTNNTGKSNFFMTTQNLFMGAFSTKHKDSDKEDTNRGISMNKGNIKKPRRLGRSSSLDVNHARNGSSMVEHKAGMSNEADMISAADQAHASRVALNVTHIWQQASRKAVIQAMQLRYDALEEELTTANQLASTLTKKCEKLMGMDEQEIQEFVKQNGGSSDFGMETDIARELSAVKMKRLEDQSEMEELRKQLKETKAKWIRDRVKGQFIRVANKTALDRVNEQNEALMDEQQRSNALFESYKRKVQANSDQQRQQTEQFRNMRMQIEMLLAKTAKTESNGEMMNQLLSQITEMEKMNEGNMTSSSLANWAKWRATERALLEKNKVIAELQEHNRQLELKVVNAFEERLLAKRNTRLPGDRSSWAAVGDALRSAQNLEASKGADSGIEEKSEANLPMSGYSATPEADMDAFHSEQKEASAHMMGKIPSLPLHKLDNHAAAVAATIVPEPNDASNLPAYSPRFESYRKLASFNSNHLTASVEPETKAKDDGETFKTSQSSSSLHKSGPTNPVALIRMSTAVKQGGAASQGKPHDLTIPESPEGGRKKKSKGYASKLIRKVGKLWRRGKGINAPLPDKLERSTSVPADGRLGLAQRDPTMPSQAPEARKKSPLRSPRRISEADLANRNPMYE